MKELLQQLDKASTGIANRVLLFLNAQGYKEQFDLLEQELRDCLVQLSAILNMSQFTSQVGCLTD
jgi:hypothetical protein